LFQRRTIANRLLAFGGAWLTLAACLQQTGSLCRLFHGDCGSRGVHAVAADFHPDRDHQAADGLANGPGDAAGSSEVPCKHECCCCQAPDAQQQTPSLDVAAATQWSSSSALPLFAAVAADGRTAGLLRESAACERPVDCCARLCRFLA
jgi:hypothetical protein